MNTSTEARLSLLAEDAAVAPPGLEYLTEFLTAHEEAALLGWIDGSEWLSDLSRRVQHYGYKYDYSTRRLDESARIGPLPPWLAELTHKIHAAAADQTVRLIDAQRPFEQAIINEYEPGQGIAPHIDRDCFGSVAATVSLGSAVDMDFSCGSTGEEYVLRLEPRSLVLLHGDARWRWRHGIAKRRTDTCNGHKVARQRRVSITFRTIAGPEATQT
ncbi:MAG: alpha-ketoglutarate-dependent dioxygenase AlkB [Acidimicrobiaceae bacterium]|nr:alpha-ketoglutarate-dependent dioxygenase AlkB [Acidimicrobiaceae bacterium]